MTYLSLYRRWRSQSFAEVVGQNHIVQTLINSLDTGRITHAYLFSGPRGTGKTTLARLFAKGLNCVNGPSSNFCQECTECNQITQGTSLDVVEIDGASNRGIDEIRELREQVRYAPVSTGYKVYIIDEVHMLTPDAFNALLKTLEEPPEKVVFILATTEPQKIPATILSRCQRFDFKRFSVEEIINHLQNVLAKEGITPELGALEIIAEHADGGMRDALGIVEQCLAYSNHLTAEVVSEVLGVATQDKIVQFLHKLDKKDASGLIEAINQLYIDGKDLNLFVKALLGYLRKAIVQKEILTPTKIHWEKQRILQIMEVLAECEREMRYLRDTSIPLELAVLKLIQPELEVSRSEIEVLRAKISELNDKIKKILNSETVAVYREKPDVQVPVSVKLNSSGNEKEKLDSIQNNWDEFLQMLRDERLVQPEAFLREGFPVGLRGDELVIAFPNKRGFHKASMEQDKHRQPAERALAKMFGFQLSVQCIISDDPVDKPDNHQSGKTQETSETSSDDINQDMSTSPETSDLPGESDLKEGPKKNDVSPDYDESVNEALRIFGGKIIDIKKNEKGGG